MVIAVFVTLEKPTSEMVAEALSTGSYRSPGLGCDYLRIQILTIADLLPPNRTEVKMPPESGTFKQVQRAASNEGLQTQLDLE